MSAEEIRSILRDVAALGDVNRESIADHVIGWDLHNRAAWALAEHDRTSISKALHPPHVPRRIPGTGMGPR